MIAKALDNLQIFKSVNKGISSGIDSLKISAKLRLFSESTKENRKYLYFLSLAPTLKNEGKIIAK